MEIVTQLLAVITQKKPTLSEIFRDFHLFLNTRDKDISNNLNTVLHGFQPSDHLQKLLWIKLVDRFKVADEVVNLLQSGDSYNIAQALKCHWYFTNLANPSYFVNEIIPSLSLSTRMRVVNKFASCLKNTGAAEELYTRLKARYGIKCAFAILPACSEGFIRNELPNIKIILPPSIMLALYKLHPSLVTEYLAYIASNKSPGRPKAPSLDAYTSTLARMSSKDFPSFMDLFEKYSDRFPYLKLGRRPTKKLIKTQSDKVVDNYSQYKRILIEKTFFTRISLDQMKKIYAVSLLPLTVTEFLNTAKWRDYFTVLTFFKPSVRADIVTQGFSMKYQRDLVSNEVLNNMNNDTWIEYLPLQDKIKWVERKLIDSENVGTQSSYISLLPVNISIPKLKKLIESQSDSTMRMSIARCMVKTVNFNRNSTAIPELVAYFVKRFRNEVVKFRETVLDELGKVDSALFLEVDNWTPLNEFINIIKLNNEVSRFKYLLRRLMIFQVQSYFKRCGEVDSCLKTFVELMKSDGQDMDCYVFEVGHKSPCERVCLEWFLKEIPEMQWAKSNAKTDVMVGLLDNVCSFNQNNLDNQLIIPEWLITEAEGLVSGQHSSYYNFSKLINILKKNPDQSIRNCLIKLGFPKYINYELITELLKSNPGVIFNNIRPIMEHSITRTNLEEFALFYKRCRLFGTFGIPSEIINICRVTLKLQTSDYDLPESSPIRLTSSQPHAMKVLSILLNPVDFLLLVERFVPTKAKIDEYTEEIQTLYDVQQAICKSFNNVTTPGETLPLLRKFAVGDYLKLTTGSINGVCIKVPENIILPLMKAWIDCPVSLRKHFLRLTYKIGPLEYSVETFINIFKTEKNISLRLVLFQQLHKSFIDEPDEDSFIVFKSIINQLNAEDEEALKTLFVLDGIDQSFICRYLELLWRLIETDWGKVLPNGKRKIVELINKNIITSLTDEFCDVILMYEMSTKLPHTSPSSFICTYLLYCSSYELQLSRFNRVMTYLSPLIKSQWDEKTWASGHVFRIRHIINDVFTSFCHASTSATDLLISPLRIVTEIKRVTSSMLEPQRFLHESFLIERTILHHGESMTSSSLAKLCNSFYLQHEQIGSPVLSCLVQYVPSNKKGDVAFELITKYDNPCLHIAAIDMLLKNVSNEESVTDYKAIYDILSSSEDIRVQAAADVFFKKLTSSLI